MIKPVKPQSFKIKGKDHSGSRFKEEESIHWSTGAQNDFASDTFPSERQSALSASNQHLKFKSPRGQSLNTQICNIYYIHVLILGI